MISTIFRLRLTQALRLLQQLGPIRSTVVLGATVVFLVIFFRAAANRDVARLGAAVTIISLTTIHVGRNDKQFLNVAFADVKRIFYTEYFIVSLPVLSIDLIRSQWFAAASLISLTPLIPFVNISFGKFGPNPKWLRWIPDSNFEWKAGVRKYFLPLMIIWFSGLLTSFFIGSVPLSIFLIGAIIMSFYDRFESVEILISKEQSARTFIHKKILNHAVLLLVVNLPLVLAFCVFHYERFYIPIIELFLFVVILAYVVCLKYAFYTQDRYSRLGQTLISLGFLGVFIPFFTPVVMLMTARYYSKAKKNLNFYLNDFD